jgi:hypothetical protein
MYGPPDKTEFTHEQVEGEDPIKEVERVKDRKGKGTKVRYLIKWVGHDEETWEPAKHLTGCKGMVKAYNDSLKSLALKPHLNPERKRKVRV